MRNLRLLVLVALAIIVLPLFISCSDDDEVGYYVFYGPNATVTIKPLGEDAFYMQLDDTTTLYATNITQPPYGNKEVRAFVNYQEVDKVNDAYTKSVHLNYVDSFLTKNSIKYIDEENAQRFGNDPIEIVPSWVNVVEDGYLTLCFNTLWGNDKIPHFVNLLTNVNPEDPYEVEFRHNAYGDTLGTPSDAVVAFKLNDLPLEKNENITITLKYKSFSGEKTVKFLNINSNYLSGSMIPDDSRSKNRLK